MKNQISIFMLFVLLFFLSCEQHNKESKLVELKAAKTLPVPNSSEIEKAVKTFNDALINPERALLENLCADNLTYGHSSGLIQNKEAFINDLINGPFDFSSVSAPEQSIHLLGETAIVRHVFLAKATNDGEPIDIRLGNIQVYQRQEDGEWKLLARQAYKL